MDHKPTYTDLYFTEIDNYFSGNLSPEEMHALEERALADPFLAAAMDGYYTQKENWEAVKNENTRLRTLLADKTAKNKTSAFVFPAWLRVAAIFLFMVLAGGITWYTWFRENPAPELAKHTTPGTQTDTTIPSKENQPPTPSLLAENKKDTPTTTSIKKPTTETTHQTDHPVETIQPAPVLASAETQPTDSIGNPVPSVAAGKVTMNAMRANKAREETVASYPIGGWDAFQLYIKNRLPLFKKEMAANYTPGNVTLRFFLNEKGEPNQFTIQQSLSPAMDSLAIRLVKEGPLWKTDNSNTEGNVNLHFTPR